MVSLQNNAFVSSHLKMQVAFTEEKEFSLLINNDDKQSITIANNLNKIFFFITVVFIQFWSILFLPSGQNWRLQFLMSYANYGSIQVPGYFTSAEPVPAYFHNSHNLK